MCQSEEAVGKSFSRDAKILAMGVGGRWLCMHAAALKEDRQKGVRGSSSALYLIPSYRGT